MILADWLLVIGGGIGLLAAGLAYLISHIQKEKGNEIPAPTQEK